MRNVRDDYGWWLRAKMLWAHWLVRPFRSWRRNSKALDAAGKERVQLAKWHKKGVAQGIRDSKSLGDVIDALCGMFGAWDYCLELGNYTQSTLAMLMQQRETGVIRGDCADAAYFARWVLRQFGNKARVVYVYGDSKAHAVCVDETGKWITTGSRVVDLKAALDGGLFALEDILFQSQFLGEAPRYTWPHYSDVTKKLGIR